MTNNFHNKNKNQKKDGFVLVILVAVICSMLLVAVFLFSAILSGQFQGVNGGGGGGTTLANGNTLDCSGAASVPADYMPWVKDAAKKYLKGDEALLIAVIQQESGWNPTEKNINEDKSKGVITHAVGLGQFQPRTAKEWPEFAGGDDKNGTAWPAGVIYDGVPPSNDARFDPKRSIYAVAHYLYTSAKSQGGDYFLGYEKVYHGGASGPAARQTLETKYATIKKGCTPTGNGGTLVAGGKGCSAIAGNAAAIANQLTKSSDDSTYNRLSGKEFVCTDLVIKSYSDAGIDVSKATRSARTMIGWFTNNSLYSPNGSAQPSPGDFIGFDSPQNTKGSGKHVGVVASVFTKNGKNCITTAEANSRSRSHTYCSNNGVYSGGGLKIEGFGRLKNCAI